MSWNIFVEIAKLPIALRPEKCESYFSKAILQFTGINHGRRAQSCLTSLGEEVDSRLLHAVFTEHSSVITIDAK